MDLFLLVIISFCISHVSNIRGMNDIVQLSGIDTICCSHSTRHAIISTAHSLGVDLDTIRKTAGWTNKS